jgi:hypothetical protein
MFLHPWLLSILATFLPLYFYSLQRLVCLRLELTAGCCCFRKCAVHVVIVGTPNEQKYVARVPWHQPSFQPFFGGVLLLFFEPSSLRTKYEYQLVWYGKFIFHMLLRFAVLVAMLSFCVSLYVMFGLFFLVSTLYFSILLIFDMASIPAFLCAFFVLSCFLI